MRISRSALLFQDIEIESQNLPPVTAVESRLWIIFNDTAPATLTLHPNI